MSTRPWVAVALLLFPICLRADPAPKTAPPPATAPASDLPDKITATTPASADLAQKLFDAERFSDAARIISRLIQLNPVTANYDRQAMLMLRAECHLHLKQVKEALDTLETVHLTAQKAADHDQDAQALALKTLIQSSVSLAYVPATGAVKLPLSIIDPSTRGAAMDALYADQLAKLLQQVTEAKASSSISGILDIAKSANVLQAVAFVTGKNAAKINASTKKLPGLAANRMRECFDACDETIRDISSAANHMERRQIGVNRDTFGNVTPIYQNVRTGLSSDNVSTLRDIESTCDRIPDAIADLVRAFGNPEPFDNRRFNAAKRAQEIRKRADDVLKKDYTK